MSSVRESDLDADRRPTAATRKHAVGSDVGQVQVGDPRDRRLLEQDGEDSVADAGTDDHADEEAPVLPDQAERDHPEHDHPEHDPEQPDRSEQRPATKDAPRA